MILEILLFIFNKFSYTIGANSRNSPLKARLNIKMDEFMKLIRFSLAGSNCP